VRDDEGNLADPERYQVWSSALNHLVKVAAIRDIDHEAITRLLRKYGSDPQRTIEDAVLALEALRQRLTEEHKSDDQRTPANRIAPRIELDREKRVVILDGAAFSLLPNGVKLLEILLGARGEYVSLASFGLRTRDIQNLPEPVQAAIESQPGAGTRIRREWLA
jgi:hypothetical protein